MCGPGEGGGGEGGEGVGGGVDWDDVRGMDLVYGGCGPYLGVSVDFDTQIE